MRVGAEQNGYVHMYPTVPTRPRTESPSEISVAKPKSDILTWPAEKGAERSPGEKGEEMVRNGITQWHAIHVICEGGKKKKERKTPLIDHIDQGRETGK